MNRDAFYIYLRAKAGERNSKKTDWAVKFYINPSSRAKIACLLQLLVSK